MPNAARQQPARVRRWKRTAVIALLLLISGAVVNIAVAWGFAYWAEFRWPFVRGAIIVRGDPETWVIQSGRERAGEWVRWSRHTWNVNESPSDTVLNSQHLGPFTGENIIMRREISADRFAGYTYWVEKRGWPLPSMFSVTEIDMLSQQASVVSGLNLARLSPRHRLPLVLPLRPYLPLFLVNMLVYAVVIWVLGVVLFAPFKARRLLRRRRGLCEQCAYPIGTWGTPVCTECGAAVRTTVARSS